MSRELGTICRAVPMETDPARFVKRPVQRSELAALLRDLELYKWLEKLGLSDQLTQPTAAADETAVPTLPIEGNEALEDVLAIAERTGRIDLLADIVQGDVRGVGLSVEGRLARVERLAPSFDRLLHLFADPTIEKRTHDSKSLFRVLTAAGIEPAGFVLDTALAAYLLNPLSSDYSLTRLMQEQNVAVTEDALAGFSVLADRLTDAVHEQGLWALLTEVEQPLALVLASMENEGVAVDRDGIVAFGQELSARIADLQTSIWEQVGYTFNLNSPKQLGKALFEDLGLPAGKKTKSGYSTSADVLE